MGNKELAELLFKVTDKSAEECGHVDKPDYLIGYADGQSTFAKYLIKEMTETEFDAKMVADMVAGKMYERLSPEMKEMYDAMKDFNGAIEKMMGRGEPNA